MLKLVRVNLVSRGRRYCGRHANVWWDDGQEGLDRRTVAIAVTFVLFLACSTILKPDLRHSLAQTGHVGDALEILPVRIAVDGEVGLKHLQLFFGEGCSDALRFVLVESVTVVAV